MTQVVKCLRCDHVWDDDDPDDYACACIDTHGSRTVVVLSEGATNTPKTWRQRIAEARAERTKYEARWLANLKAVRDFTRWAA